MQITTLPQALERIDYLETEVMTLKTELGHIVKADVATRLSRRWRLTPKEAKVLAHLASVRGRLTTKESIMSAIYEGSDDEPQMKIVDVFVCKIRNKIGEGLIDTVWGQGYRLSALGIAEIDQVLNCELAQMEPAPRPAARVERFLGRNQYRILSVLKEKGPLEIAAIVRELPAADALPLEVVRNAISSCLAHKRVKAVDWRPGPHGRRRTIFEITTAGRGYLALHARSMSDIAA